MSEGSSHTHRGSSHFRRH